VPRRNRKPDHRRITIAQEAARIIQEQGLTDFRSAKEKAVTRLGLEQQGALPSNEEIEQALAERQRIFRGDAHEEYISALRLAALEFMRDLQPFEPRLVGPVLNGSATEHAMIDLHLFSDAAEDVATHLDALGLQYRVWEHRLRLRRDEVEAFPGYRLRNGQFEFSLAVFPERFRGHAPLSPVDGRPMRRAGLRDVEALLSAS
jgi:hypothetical protein